MPAILDEERVTLWLDSSTNETAQLQSILLPASNDLLRAISVSNRVNSYKNNDSRLIEEASISEPAAVDRQLGLFDDYSE
ncbi:MAG: SOS response-associated peptidase family protein [Chloroflexi bacterium]|nr:SOS response-associated peptidase family protein [Chloroflexota bacterium]